MVAKKKGLETKGKAYFLGLGKAIAYGFPQELDKEKAPRHLATGLASLRKERNLRKRAR